MKLELLRDNPLNETMMRDTETGLVMPWLTRPCLAWLDRQKFSSVFEWGVGRGAEWWRSRAKYTGIEHNPEWANADDVRIHAIDDPNYVNSIKTVEPQDIVVIDGEHRVDCAQALWDCCWHPKHLILDNANWPPYCDIFQMILDDWDCPMLNTQLFWDVDHADWLTAVFSTVPVTP